MNFLVKVVVVILALLFIAKEKGVTLDSAVCFLIRSTEPKLSISILCNDNCLSEKDQSGLTLNEYITRHVSGSIEMDKKEGYFRMDSNSYTLIRWSDDNFANPRRYRIESKYGDSVMYNFVIRPVIIVAHRDEVEERNSVDGTDLIVYVNIFAKEYKVWMDGESEPDNNEWKNGQPELPEFMVTRDSKDQFTWTDSPRSRCRARIE